MPQFPTDNLYKFMALAGLFVAAFSTWISLQKFVEYNRATLLLDSEYGAMIPTASRMAELSLKNLACSISEAEERESKTRSDPTACQNVDAAKAESDQLGQKLRELEEHVRPMSVNRDALWQEYRMYRAGALVVGVLGLYLTGLGFWWWYDRLQRHLDAAVKADSRPKRWTSARVGRGQR